MGEFCFQYRVTTYFQLIYLFANLMHFHVITLFKEGIDSYLNESILGRAKGEGKIKVTYYNPREFTDKKVAYIDGKPYGGGPGMVLQALPFIKAVEAALTVKKRPSKERGSTEASRPNVKTKVIIFSPQGKQFTNEYARNLVKKYTNIILIAGRYEGIDARVRKILKAEEISVGPFVLTGGEIPAAIVIDAVSRQLEGVLGNFNSREEARTAAKETYTRPEVLLYKGKKYRVPKVLLSGDHKKIEEWKKKDKKPL